MKQQQGGPYILHTPQNTVERIETLWAVVSQDEGGEGLCGARIGGQWISLTTTSEKHVRSFLIPAAREVAAATGRRLKLLKFTGRVDVEDVTPEGAGRG